MHYFDNGYRGISTFVSLNADRALVSGVTVCAILLAAWVQSF